MSLHPGGTATVVLIGRGTPFVRYAPTEQQNSVGR